MTSRDSYRRPVSTEAALAELRRVSGTQLDPLVAAAFEQMIVVRRASASRTPTRPTSSPSWTPVRSSEPTRRAEKKGELHSFAPRGNAAF